MDIAILGGHGKIALLLEAQLAEAGHTSRAIIRNPHHADDVRRAGAHPVLCDIESPDSDLEAAVRGADAVVFAAGAGPGSGAERKRTVDLGGAVALIEAAKAAGVGRYLIVSSIGTHDAESTTGDMGPYLLAKKEADEAVMASGLDYTIVRPGGLTDEEPTGAVHVAERVERAQIPRADVAAVLLAALTEPASIGKAFEVVSGDVAIADALAGL